MTYVRQADGSVEILMVPEELQELGLQDGDRIAVTVRLLEVVRTSDRRRPIDHSNEVAKAFDASWKRNEPGYRYLAGR